MCPRDSDFDSRKYQPFDQSCLYYDDMMKKMHDDVQSYNRISLIIQGILDRSTALHPHWSPKLYKQEDFERAVELVFDGSRVLYDGDPPDFEAYREGLRASITAGSVVIGQEGYWLSKMAERYNADQRRYRRQGEHEREHYRPDGNPGPGYIGQVHTLKRTGKAYFEWQCERRVYRRTRWDRSYDKTWTGRIDVPLKLLFNISAYKPGDFKRFYDDPRTRAQYLKWANLLLTAEEYHAGNVSIGPSAIDQINDKKWQAKRAAEAAAEAE